jgi:hypothetical protein
MSWRGIWGGAFWALAISAEPAAAELPYCPRILLQDGASIDVIRLVADGSGREIFSARWISFSGIGYIQARFDVTSGDMKSPESLRFGISDGVLPPHRTGPPLTAALSVKGVSPWRTPIARTLPQDYFLDEFVIEPGRDPQFAEAFMQASSAEVSVSKADGAVVLTRAFPLPSPGDWAELRRGVRQEMAMVQAGTCQAHSTTISQDLKTEGAPPLIIHPAGPHLPTSH